MKNIKHKVEQLLMVYPSMRDDRDHCIRKLLEEQNVQKYDEISVILSADRYWRMIQNENENLRGENWKARQERKVAAAKKIQKFGLIK